jgi:hypothetical protein
VLLMDAFFDDDLVGTSAEEVTASATTGQSSSRSANETSRSLEEWTRSAEIEIFEQAHAARLYDRVSPVDLLLDDRVSATSHSGYFPEKWDILCGRGRGFFEHPGNRRFLSILEPFKDEYQTANKPEKSTIAHRVMMLIIEPAYPDFQVEDTRLAISMNGHCIKFWRKHADDTSFKVNKKKKTDDDDRLDSFSWVQLDEKESLKKIAHTLREQKTIVRSSVARSKSPPPLDTTKSAPSWRKQALPPIFVENNVGTGTKKEPSRASKHHPSIVFSPATSGRSSGILASTTAISVANPSPIQKQQPPLSSFLSQLRSEAPFFAHNINDHQLLDSPLYYAMGGSSDVALLLNQPLLTLSKDDFADCNTSSSYDQHSSPTEYGGNSTS